MVKFTSLSQISKFANTPQGQAELLKMKSAEIEKLLINASHELEGYLKEGLQAYFDSYTPTEYERTGQTMRDIKVGMPTQTSHGVWNVSIGMDSPHQSLFGGEDGNTLSLINTGFEWGKQPDTTIEHFSRFEGTNYIQEAVEKFNKNNRYGMSVKVLFNGNDVTGFSYNYGK